MEIVEPMLTTSQLLEACESATGVRFSVHQLGDFVEVGWLPRSRPAPGRGRGVRGPNPRLWPMECLQRLIVIARSRTGRYVNKAIAAEALAKAGYLLTGRHLREQLHAWLFEWNSSIQAALVKKRPYLTQPISAAEKRKRFHRSEQRGNGAFEPKLRASVELVKLTLLHLSEGHEGNALAEFAEAINAERVTASLDAATDQEIVDTYEQVGRVLPWVATMTLAGYADMVGHEQQLLAPYPDHERAHAEIAALMQVFRGIIAAGPEALASNLRLPLTLWALHMRQEHMGESFDELLVKATGQVSEMLHIDVEAMFQAALQAAGDHVEPNSIASPRNQQDSVISENNSEHISNRSEPGD